MKRFKVGQRVRLSDPASVCTQFFSPTRGGIVGAGYSLIPREALEGDFQVFALVGSGKTDVRGLIESTSVRNEHGQLAALWVDAEDCESAKRGKRT